jgi:hypothetical protein
VERHQAVEYPVALKSPGVIEIPSLLFSLPFLGFGTARDTFGIPKSYASIFYLILRALVSVSIGFRGSKDVLSHSAFGSLFLLE